MILREILGFSAIAGCLLILCFAGVGISYVYDMSQGARICMEVQR